MKAALKTWWLGQNRWSAMLESVLFAALLFFISYYHANITHYYLTRYWVWLAPILIALRYGVSWGGVAALTLLTLQAYYLPKPPWYAPQSDQALVGLFLTLLCGQFRSTWHEKIERSSELLGYAQQRLNHLSRIYFMTRISHDRMEYNLISKPVTIRSALLDLRQLLLDSQGDFTKNSAGLVLDLVSQTCSLEHVALYPVVHGEVQENALASIGPIEPLLVHDYLIQEALEHESIAYQSVNKLAEDQWSRYLVVAPLIDLSGEVFALLVVSRMAFLRLNENNLRSMSVLLNYIAADRQAVKAAGHFLKKFTDCPSDFAAEFVKLQSLQKNVGIDSCLVALFVENSKAYESIIPALQLQKRGLDLTWVHQRQQDTVLFTLMPISEPMAMEGYVRRVRLWLKAERGLSFDFPRLHIRYISVDQRSLATQIEELSHVAA